jgi:hypothetical protein
MVMAVLTVRITSVARHCATKGVGGHCEQGQDHVEGEGGTHWIATCVSYLGNERVLDAHVQVGNFAQDITMAMARCAFLSSSASSHVRCDGCVLCCTSH